MISLRRNHPVYISKRKEHSISRHAVRAKVDSCLHDDVEDFMAKRGARLDILLDKLLNNDFIRSSRTNPF